MSDISYQLSVDLIEAIAWEIAQYDVHIAAKLMEGWNAQFNKRSERASRVDSRV